MSSDSYRQQVHQITTVDSVRERLNTQEQRVKHLADFIASIYFIGDKLQNHIPTEPVDRLFGCAAKNFLVESEAYCSMTEELDVLCDLGVGVGTEDA